MSGYADAAPAGRGPLPYEFQDFRWSGRRRGPPLAVKVLAVAAAFWLFHPLGVAMLVYFLWRAARRNGGCLFHGAEFARHWDAPPWAPGRGRAASRNTAFEERRRETLKQLDEEAEAFDAFERTRREARDREAFGRFMADRNAPKDGPETH